MLKNITLSAEEELIQKAEERAALDNTTLNASFRQWLKLYTNSLSKAEQYDQLMESLSYAEPGRKFSRDEANER